MQAQLELIPTRLLEGTTDNWDYYVAGMMNNSPLWATAGSDSEGEDGCVGVSGDPSGAGVVTMGELTM